MILLAYSFHLFLFGLIQGQLVFNFPKAPTQLPSCKTLISISILISTMSMLFSRLLGAHSLHFPFCTIFQSYLMARFPRTTRFQHPNGTDAGSSCASPFFLSTSTSTTLTWTRFFPLIEGTCKLYLVPRFLSLPPFSWLILHEPRFWRPSPHEIHFWWLVLHGLHFWCPISTRDPLLVARFHGLHFWCPISIRDPLLVARFHGLHFWCPISTRDPLLVARPSWAALLVPHLYTGSTSGGSSFMGCTSGAPYLHGIHFWWLVLQGLQLPRLYMRSASGGSLFMGCTPGAHPYLGISSILLIWFFHAWTKTCFSSSRILFDAVYFIFQFISTLFCDWVTWARALPRVLIIQVLRRKACWLTANWDSWPARWSLRPRTT